MPRVISYGGGLDSFVMLLGAIARGIFVDAVVFCDVTDAARLDPGEWPSTYRHIDEVVRPLCEAHGIELVVLDTEAYPIRGERSLFAYFERKRIIPGTMTRLCTSAAKVERFAAWLDRTYAGQDVEVWVGFEAGEEKRAANDPHGGKAEKAKKGHQATRRNRFPLIEWQLCRCRCEQLVRDAGHPVPRKSACVYCPMASKGDWQTLQRELPEQFDRIAALEANMRPTKAGKQLSIMGYRNGVPTPLPVFTAKSYTRRVIPCAICGAAQRATKATGCDYLDDEAPEATPAATSWKPEFFVEGTWCSNSQRFATRDEAESSARARFIGWTVATGSRVVETTDPVTYARVDGHDLMLADTAGKGA